MQELADHENPWTVFVETVNPETELDSLPMFDKEGMCWTATLRYIRHGQRKPDLCGVTSFYVIQW